jgi:hypothetical protein
MPEDNLRMKGILSLKAVITGTSPIKQRHMLRLKALPGESYRESLNERVLPGEPYRDSLTGTALPGEP